MSDQKIYLKIILSSPSSSDKISWDGVGDGSSTVIETFVGGIAAKVLEAVGIDEKVRTKDVLDAAVTGSAFKSLFFIRNFLSEYFS